MELLEDEISFLGVDLFRILLLVVPRPGKEGLLAWGINHFSGF
jgi:hypothetical protein